MSGQEIVRWRAWYTEGRVYDGNSFNDWVELPDDGALTIMLWHEDGTRRVEQGNDYYWATPDGIYGHSNDTFEDIERRYQSASIKRGKWTTDTEMERVAAEAMGA